MSELYGKIGEITPEILLGDPAGAEVIAVPCEPGNGIVKRGTILYRKSSGMYAPAATGDVVITNELVVIDEAVNTDANMVIAEDARAYRSGRFVKGKVTLKNDGTVTAAHEVVLRAMGITFKPMQKTDNEYTNINRVITYKANNSASPAEADVVRYAYNGTTHTVLANSVTEFTAPTGEAFSKWNTKADGTGTDYAAAASYTANADLTLYAVWA